MQPSAEEVLAELERIKASQTFLKSDRGLAILEYIIRQKLNGAPVENFKEIVIGTVVYGEGYDPQTSPKVRVAIGRMRVSLASYYEREGKMNPVRIAIENDYYVPKFSRAPHEQAVPVPAVKPVSETLKATPASTDELCPACGSLNIKYPSKSSLNEGLSFFKEVFLLPFGKSSTDRFLEADDTLRCGDCGAKWLSKGRLAYKKWAKGG